MPIAPISPSLIEPALLPKQTVGETTQTKNFAEILQKSDFNAPSSPNKETDPSSQSTQARASAKAQTDSVDPSLKDSNFYLQSLSHSPSSTDQTMSEQILNGSHMNQEKMLALQMRVYDTLSQIQEASKLIEVSSSAIKTVFQTQV